MKDVEIARHLAENGVPIFLAKRAPEFPRGGTDGRGYILPQGWQYTEPDSSVLDDYSEGDAVCAVMGHAVDAIDRDPRNGGSLPSELQPKIYGRQSTPSGGTHELIAPLGVRSRDGILPGIDVKAGHEGEGTGFIFIAPTQRPNHDGEVATYRWTQKPDLTTLTLIGESEPSGAALADIIDSARAPSGDAAYKGPSYDELDPDKQSMAEQAQRERINSWREMLTHAAQWPEGRRDPKGRGWEALTRDMAWSVASMAANPWMPMVEEEAEELYHSLLPDVIAQDPKCQRKWYPGLVSKAAAKAAEMPPWSDFDVVSIETVRAHALPQDFDDANMADWMMAIGLNNRFCWSPGLGWMEWTGKRWREAALEHAREEVRQAVIALNLRAQEAGMDTDYMKRARGLLTSNKIFSLTTLMRGVSTREADEFDAYPHLLNVGNGIVDLRTGRLLPHDPKFLLTKTSDAAYVPDAQHDDLDQVLTALEPEVMDWMQIRFGQAASGFATPDDVLPIGQGQGSNGKTTLLAAVQGALGDHAVTVPDRVIQARPSDHPTELMMLKGARLAIIDETPEAAQLNVQRLKSVLGADVMTARKIQKDSVSWKPTHSLFLMTNYSPMVREADEGTWRRLALVKFDKKFPKNDAFRARVSHGSPEMKSATLSWIVRGAIRWYANNQTIPEMPARVAQDTEEWRYSSDAVSEFVEEYLEFDPHSAVLASEFYQGMVQWLEANNRARWSDQLFASRIENSRVMREAEVHRKRRVYKNTFALDISTQVPGGTVPKRPTVWTGLRWKQDDLL